MSGGHGGAVSRRGFLRAAGGTAAAAAVGASLRPPAATASPAPVGERVPLRLRQLEAKIRAGMERYAIPGVAVGVWYRGMEYVCGFGVTSIDDPVPVDADTVFRVASTTKTFTGTAIMRLVERGRIDLDRTVRSYLPDFQGSDPSAAARVTVRHLLNHTAGWVGDDFRDTGAGEDALARFVAGMTVAPQLTEPGTVFSYNNSAFVVAGRLIEVVTGKPYERAMRELVIDPLGLRRSRFFAEEFGGSNVAAPHNVVDGRPVVEPAFDFMPRSLHPAGGLISSARDQLRYARFHLGDGRVPGGGTRLLDRRSLNAMRSRPGPGGTVLVELDGMGVSWMLRPSAEGVRILQHGGDWAGHHSGFLMVPDRNFAFTMLTNSESGPELISELFAGDWALRRLAGVSNLPAVPRVLPATELADYEGVYLMEQFGLDGTPQVFGFELVGDRGRLAVPVDGERVPFLAFYRADHVVFLDDAGEPAHTRADFVRGADGEVAWLRFGGRLLRRTPVGSRIARTLPLPTGRVTLPHPRPTPARR